ncbi:MAG: hypothetical protein HZA95_00290 [Candidatus Vogelbacteria bacterium]|nr:hypothetical protein [Candidatus Vogelbacteria bacterium]
MNEDEKVVLDYLFQTHSIYTGKKRNCVVAMVGVCASGKTTVARALAEKLNLHYVSADEVRVILRTRNPKANYEHVRTIIDEFVFNRLCYSEGSVIDSDFGNSGKRLLLEAMIADGTRCPVFFIRTTCDMDVMVGRAIDNIPDLFFVNAGTIYQGDNKGAVVKIREMIRQLPKHYSWSGGRWTLLPTKGIFATIDTSDDATPMIQHACARIVFRLTTGQSVPEDCVGGFPQ